MWCWSCQVNMFHTMTVFRFSLTNVQMFSLFFTSILSTIACQDNPRVNTPLGEMEGIVKIVRNENVYQFRNIPYAKSPTGNLRFAKPIPHGPWSGVLNATRFGPSCLQFPYRNAIYNKYKPNLEMSEDCLSLNVYVARNISVTGNRSVMVWIHGGSYYIGQGSLYDGSYLALTGDVVVVTLNYRLGAFGFMASPKHGIYGNYGLWDQRLALKWVQSNIEYFGGNPKSVTIFGQSAGGFSVSLHAILPVNEGMFHRVISESGSPEGSFTIWKSAAYTSEALITLSHCDISNSTLICMQNRSASGIVSDHHFLVSPRFLNTYFQLPSGPVVDNDLIHMDPTSMLMNKTSLNYQFFRSLDFMTGNVDTEGSISINIVQTYIAMYDDIYIGMSRDTFCKYYLPGLTKFYFGEMNISVASDFLCSLYGSSNPPEQALNAMHTYADANFLAPAVRSLVEHSEDNYFTNSFQYLFRRPDIDPAIRHLYEHFTNGSTHGAETAYLFGLEDYQELYNISVMPADISLSKTMLKYWTNFAKTGNPSADDVPRWDNYDVTRQNYVNLDINITQGQHLYESRVDIWLKKLPKFLQGRIPGIIVG